MLDAHDLGINCAAFCPSFLTNDSYGQIDLQTAGRKKLGGSQDEHSAGAHVKSGEEFLEQFPVGINAARKKRKREWQARALTEFRV